MIRSLAAIALILIALTVFFYLRKPDAFTPSPLTWEECLKTPGATMITTYPGQCVAPDGSKATQPLSKKYSCPDRLEIDCMPNVKEENLKYCDPSYREWAKTNCHVLFTD